MSTEDLPAEKIAPCPFCGHEDAPLVKDVRELMPTALGLEEDYVVVCSVLYPGDADNRGRTGCGATSGAQHTAKDAIKAWNRRVYVLEVSK
jgi:hypothetical protein